MRDRDWMQLAYEQAVIAKDRGEVPIGAVLVSSEGVLLAAAHNQVESAKDPTRHAELVVIQQAAAKIENQRLLGTTLFVTLEPCPMCAGALVLARIKRLVFATRDWKTGAAGSLYNLLQDGRLNHRIEIDEGVLQPECSHLLTRFFK